jgi:hypothetical protein
VNFSLKNYILLQGEPIPFKPFTNRFNTPYPASGSTAPYWYSIKRGPAYIIAMNAYSAFGKYLPSANYMKIARAS